MGGHGHGEAPYKIPPYTQFQVKGIKELEELEAALAKKSLKDPWIRNEAWRYHPGFGTKLQRARVVFFRGFSVGLGLTVVTVLASSVLGGGGGHGHDGDGHGHAGDH